MAPIWAYQPFKAIYVAGASLYVMALALCYIPPSLRPIREWSWALSSAVAIFRETFRFYDVIRYQQPRQVTPGKAKERFVMIAPPRDQLRSGVTGSTSIEPEPVPALWFPSPVLPSPDGEQPKAQRVWIHFAGGAFVLGWDPEAMGGIVANNASSYFKATNTLYVQYRLAGPGSCFPAALQDAFTSYQHVLSLGVAPEDIFVSGDSAGGNLVLALLRYMETSHPDMPLPGGALLWSPWVDLRKDIGTAYMSLRSARADMLRGSLLQWGTDAYTPADLTPEVEPYVSPLRGPFRSRTPIFVQAGACEAFCDTIKAFATAMAQVEGNKIRYKECAGMPHDAFLAHSNLLDKKAAAEVEAAMADAEEFFATVRK